MTVKSAMALGAVLIASKAQAQTTETKKVVPLPLVPLFKADGPVQETGPFLLEIIPNVPRVQIRAVKLEDGSNSLQLEANGQSMAEILEAITGAMGVDAVIEPHLYRTFSFIPLTDGAKGKGIQFVANGRTLEALLESVCSVGIKKWVSKSGTYFFAQKPEAILPSDPLSAIVPSTPPDANNPNFRSIDPFIYPGGKPNFKSPEPDWSTPPRATRGIVIPLLPQSNK